MAAVVEVGPLSSLTDRRWSVHKRLDEAPTARLEIRAHSAPLAKSLTPRQHAVVDGLARGLSNGEIGYELGISESTVANHVSLALEVLGLPRLDLPLLAVAEPRRDGVLWSADLADLFPELTRSQLDVTARILVGDTNQSIARARRSALRTVANHVREVFVRLGVSSRLELSLLAATRSRGGVRMAA